MTVYTLMAPMPPLTLTPLMILKLEAISPTTGAAITGVTCSHWAVYGKDSQESGVQELEPTGPFILVPGPKNVEPVA